MWIVTVLGGILSVPIQVALGGLLNGVKAKFKVINLSIVIIKDIKVEESIYYYLDVAPDFHVLK